MSGIERRHQRRIDEMILNASPEELARIQAADADTQLSGDSFYDLFPGGVELASPAGQKKRAK